MVRHVKDSALDCSKEFREQSMSNARHGVGRLGFRWCSSIDETTCECFHLVDCV